MGHFYRIRDGLFEDILALQRIERDAAQRYRQIGYDFCAEGPVRAPAEHGRGLTKGALFVAVGPARLPVGFALLWWLDASIYLAELAVSPDHQGRGLGRRLIRQAETWARREGATEITLTTYRDVTWNAPFYERLGYVVFSPDNWRVGLRAVQREEIDLGFARYPRVAMRKDLRNLTGLEKD